MGCILELNTRRLASLAGLLLLAAGLCGCRTAGFYAQAVSGQFSLLHGGRKITKLLAKADLDPALRQRLLLAQSLRQFAHQELAMDVDGLYTSYSDLERPFAVWNITAASEFSLEAKTWWYPVVGSLDYRGYFSPIAAGKYAAFLRQKGFDVHVGGVVAYSTLGWFDDPVLNTFLFDPEPELAETLFHELAHGQLFARGDTDFSEAFATAVGQEGTRRWLRRSGQHELLAQYLQDLDQERQFVRLVEIARRELEQVYGDTRDEKNRIRARKEGPPEAPEILRRKKQAIFSQFREQYEALPWSATRSRDAWVQEPLNNAKLNSIANYHDLLPGFEALLRRHGGDLQSFYAAARRLANLPSGQRRAELRVLALGACGDPARPTDAPAGPGGNE